MTKFSQKLHQLVAALRSKVFCLAVSFSSSKSEKRSIQRHWELWKFLILLCFNRSLEKNIWIRKWAVKICVLKKKTVFAIMLFFCSQRNLRVVSSTYFCHFVVPPESHTRFLLKVSDQTGETPADDICQKMGFLDLLQTLYARVPSGWFNIFWRMKNIFNLANSLRFFRYSQEPPLLHWPAHTLYILQSISLALYAYLYRYIWLRLWALAGIIGDGRLTLWWRCAWCTTQHKL